MAEKSFFGTTRDGVSVEQYTLRAGALSCDILTYGGALRALRVPDRTGKAVDVALGFDSVGDYETQNKFMGALVGRFANRIGGASFSLNGREYPLAANNNAVNHLHGGVRGFDKQVWTVGDAGEENRLVLKLTSPGGQEGYPGTLEAAVTYELTEEGLSLSYLASCDQDTLCNLTNHTYFNLAGQDSGPVLDQMIQLHASFFTPTDNLSIPTGEILRVDGTPMDLRAPHPIGARIDEDFPQLVLAGGYDHNWAVDGPPGVLRPAALAWCQATGIRMEVLTTQPGVQFYTGNHLAGCIPGKGGAPYGNRWGFCLETQRFPDGPHYGHFPSCVLRAGALYREETAFRFSVLV